MIRLLSYSRTFVWRDIPMGRYRVLGARGLPRFGDNGRGFRSSVTPATLAGQPVAHALGVEFPDSGAQAPLPLAETPRASDGVDPVEGRGLLARAIAWAVGLPGRLRRRRNPFGSGLAAAPVVPRQGSLALEGVKVVRNDLSDTDVEVVAPRRRTPARPASRPPAPPEPPAPVACDFVEAEADTEEAPVQVGARGVG